MFDFKKIPNFIKSKPKLKIYLIIAAVGIFLMVIAGSLKGNDDKSSGKENKSSSSDVNTADISNENKEDLEKKVEDLLGNIKGIGSVKVLITYKSGSEYITDKDKSETNNSTKEQDSEGGSRETNESKLEEDTVYQESKDGGKQPFVKKEIYPEIRGVAVVAEGASNEDIKEKIIRSLEVLLDLPAHKIQVLW